MTAVKSYRFTHSFFSIVSSFIFDLSYNKEAIIDTEVYSNTGGQASKASNIGQVAQFAAAGKAIGKKNLAEIAMSYGYVYVAQVAMGYDMNQLLKALTEAEAYHGPSLIIGYAPCEMHSVKGGMQNCQLEMKKDRGKPQPPAVP